MPAPRYAMVVHPRLSDDDPARAIVVSSWDGHIWHALVETDLDTAHEIVDAFATAALVEHERARASHWWEVAEQLRDLTAGVPCSCSADPSTCVPHATATTYEAAVADDARASARFEAGESATGS